MPDDFMAFVRSALTAVNTKLDNIMTLQSSMEKKLSDIDARVTGQATKIAGLMQSAEFNSSNINERQKSIDIVKKALLETNRDLQSATASTHSIMSVISLAVEVINQRRVNSAHA